MKNLLLTIVSAMMMALLAPSKLYAQLNVNSNGSVNLSSTSTATNKVTVGLSNNTSYTSANFYSGMASLSQPMNAAISGNIQLLGSATGKSAIGVFGGV